MPLLKRKVFEKAKVPEYLRDDEEVFHCEVTNEIFRDYEEFCERMILVNSMVWTCSMTARNNLTYAEALESEENARKNLRDFPTQLRVPLLYLASKTERKAFSDMAQDVWSFVRDRYFVNEVIEACLPDGNWYDAQILQVMAPTEASISPKKAQPGSLDPYSPKAYKFRYEVEKASDDNQIFIIEAANVRRKKNQYTRDKSKLFFRQFTEAAPSGIWRVKGAMYQKYNINRVTFEQIFDGPLPDFSKKPTGSTQKQTSMMKFLQPKANGKDQPKKPLELNKDNKKNLVEAMKKRAEEMKQRAEEQRRKAAEERLKRIEDAKAKRREEREETARLAAIMKSWYRPKDDLDLEDHKQLPVPTPVETKIPTEHFGDVIMILDFISSFYDTLNAKRYLGAVLSLETMERALLTKEINGPFTDILKVLLEAVFDMEMDEEKYMKNEHKSKEKNPLEILTRDPAIIEIKKQATIVNVIPTHTQGLTLSQMLIDGLTITEILRLHLLSSGCNKPFNLERWRYLQRGGYLAEDNPGIQLQLDHPHIIPHLATHHVAELPLEDKLRILNCLITQVSTYSEIRDIIEDRLEKIRQTTHSLKMLGLAERKGDSTLVLTNTKLRKDYKKMMDEEPTREGKERMKLELDAKLAQAQHHQEKQQKDLESQIDELNKQLRIKITKSNYLGTDRCFRKYYFIQCLPAVLVDYSVENVGPCVKKSPLPHPELLNADQATIINYVKATEAKAKLQTNGISEADTKTLHDLCVCTASRGCPVHAPSPDTPKWGFFHKVEDIENIINALNKRGLRESELQQTFIMNKSYLEQQVALCPADKLSPEIPEPEVQKRTWGVKARYTNSNFGLQGSLSEIMELTLRDYLLDLEQQIFSGGLGSLPVESRREWRKTLESKRYEIKWLKHNSPEVMKKFGVSGAQEGQNGITNGSIDLKDDIKMEVDNHIEETKYPSEQIDVDNKIILGFATAMQSLAAGVHDKYLSCPLGQPTSTRKKKNQITTRDHLPHWNKSLMKCTSLSQLFVHYSTLETSIDLSKSALNARCFSCRKSSNDDQLLICDGCNKGQHLYCVVPKLLKVPDGDWYCDNCKPEEIRPKKQRNNKRKTFAEASDDEQQHEEPNTNGVQPKTKHKPNYVESDQSVGSDEDFAMGQESILEVCAFCARDGQLLCCDGCPKMYHPECVNPPLKRIPRGDWHCSECKKEKPAKEVKKERVKRLGKRNRDRATMEVANVPSDATASATSSDEATSNNNLLSRARRCARTARDKIHGFARSLRRRSLDSSSDVEEERIIKKKNIRRNSRKNELSNDLPLHNAPLQELLAEVLKHPSAWPFTQPVKKCDVPDYFNIITHPMDFGTIKYKLNMGKYQYDEELMADAMLVFENCNTYNDSDADVYKCGVKVLKFFKKKATELGFKVPKTISGMDEDADEIDDTPVEIIKTKIPMKKPRLKIKEPEPSSEDEIEEEEVVQEEEEEDEEENVDESVNDESDEDPLQ